jgi:hypothetical protein
VKPLLELASRVRNDKKHPPTEIPTRKEEAMPIRIDLHVPGRDKVHHDSLTAMLQDLLDIAAPDGPSWKRGYAAFWITLAEGKSASVDPAFRAAIEVAADGAPNRDALIKAALDECQKWDSDDGEQPAPKKKGTKGVLADLKAAFIDRQPPAHR